MFRFPAPIFPGMLALLLLFLPNSLLHAQEARQIEALVAEGLPGLALKLIDLNQPDQEKARGEWHQWLQRKVALLKQQGMWQEVIASYEALPEDTDANFLRWYQLQVAEAYLALGDGGQARSLLLPTIWGDGKRPESLADWRRLVVHSYLVEGRQADANAAMLRFNQDYPHYDPAEWAWLKEWVELGSDNGGEAGPVEGGSGPRWRGVYLLTRLKRDAVVDIGLLKEAYAYLTAGQLPLELTQELYLAVFKGVATLSAAAQIDYLERLLTIPVTGIDMTPVADTLWQAYEAYGLELANAAQLLRGRYQPWFEAAESRIATLPVQAKSLYAWLALNGGKKSVMTEGHTQLVKLSRPEVLRPLYLASSRFAELKQVPPLVMLGLVDAALAVDDVKHAVQLINVAGGGGRGEARLDWQLRRARIQILTGMAPQSVQALRKLAVGSSLSREQLDYFIETVADLKNSGGAPQAFELLNLLLDKVPEVAMHRELLFWMGDSLVAQGRHSEAAAYYLRSANLLEAGTMDPWARLARYQASRALVAAGLTRDAITVLEGLIAAGEEGSRSVLWKHELRALRRLLYQEGQERQEGQEQEGQQEEQKGRLGPEHQLGLL